ncbi:glutathione S-transferase family protein [Rivibacter subsaxonicus]|uniref:Glutathione S-transferase n=1 Tax=Rivibacter subsaxonicus TaxID=457575 RepID=A0A4Q7V580_9BURK|nr:glutathione S-transferase family protein [Rivibacter subsaxonicus]RZT91425.1 glutathione S-transferase [Rivibacter subsaxonicus]
MSLPELILHHYPTSPFSEKVRLVLGAKSLTWRSVRIPVIMPKPDVLALTGGYRKTPLLQIGADIYCDTGLICRVLDRLQPAPALYPAQTAGTAQMLAEWAESKLFWNAVPFAMQPAAAPYLFGDTPPEAIKAFGADRASFGPQTRRNSLVDGGNTLQHYLAWLETHLGDDRGFLVRGELSIADFAVYHPLWFLQLAPELARQLEPHPRLRAWLERMRAFGHGTASKMTSTEAIELAATTEAHAPVAVEPGLGFEAGQRVTIAAADYGTDPSAGVLVGLTRDSVTIERLDERAGRVHVHFPRLGFQIHKEKTS